MKIHELLDNEIKSIKNSTLKDISYNSLTSSVGGNTVTASQRAIFIPTFSNASTLCLIKSFLQSTLSVSSATP